MKKYYWEITYDHINRDAPDESEVGTFGGDPRIKGKNGDKGHTFSLYADDELCFRGRLWGDFSGLEPENAFVLNYGTNKTEVDGALI